MHKFKEQKKEQQDAPKAAKVRTDLRLPALAA